MSEIWTNRFRFLKKSFQTHVWSECAWNPYFSSDFRHLCVMSEIWVFIFLTPYVSENCICRLKTKNLSFQFQKCQNWCLSVKYQYIFILKSLLAWPPNERGEKRERGKSNFCDNNYQRMTFKSTNRNEIVKYYLEKTNNCIQIKRKI